MNLIEDPDKLNLKFLETSKGIVPCLQVVLTIEINDSLLMFHICHMYRNACILDKTKTEGSLQKFKDTLNLEMVILSLQENLKQKLKKGDDSYINTHYKEIKEIPEQFDECLDLFVKVKDEFEKKKMEYQSKSDIDFQQFV